MVVKPLMNVNKRHPDLGRIYLIAYRPKLRIARGLFHTK